MNSHNSGLVKTLTRHLFFPTLLPLAFFAIAFTPLSVIGCRMRGLLALLIAVVSTLEALAAMVRSRRAGRGTIAQIWWIVSALIMTVPPIALIILA